MAEIDISKMKAEDFKKDLMPMVVQLEADYVLTNEWHLLQHLSNLHK